MNVTIRPAVTADRPEIETASRATWHAHNARQPYAFPANGWDFFLKHEHEFAFWSGAGLPIGESGNLFVAEADGKFVGFVLLSWHLRDDVPNAPDGTIIDIWVQPDWRRKGVGRNLVAFARDMADEADWDNLTAQVWTGAPSEGLFARAGFTPQSVTWRHGPERPAKPVQPSKKKHENEKNDTFWMWSTFALMVALFVVIVTQV